MSLAIGLVSYPSLGGSGVVAAELATGLAERGHEVHVIATAPPVRSLPGGARVRFHEVATPDYPLFEHPPYALALAARIAEVSTEHHLQLVHVHYAVPHAAAAYLARRMLGAAAPRVVTSLHGTDVTRVGVDPAYRSVTRFTVAASDGITVPSRFLEREARGPLGIGPGVEIEIIPNFVDADRFAPPPARDRSRFDHLFGGPGGPVLFHVSNFLLLKRTADLMVVLAKVRERVPARLVLVGDGPERPLAEVRARELGLEAHVRFLGRRADFVEDLGHAAAFVLPSETESFGVAALEALSAGVPVCGYAVGGLPEVVVPAAGRLVAPFDAAALADAVLEVVDPARRDGFGAAARAHVLAGFRRAPALDCWETYYRRVLARPPVREET